MTTVSLDRLAQYTARGAAPPLRECLAALAAGRLWDVDSGGCGHDCIAVSDDAEDVIHETAALVDFIDPVGLGWSSQAVTALCGTLYDGMVQVEATPWTEPGILRVILRAPACDGDGPVPSQTGAMGVQHDWQAIHRAAQRLLSLDGTRSARTVYFVGDDTGERWCCEVSL
jgi:hypothetical protein